VLPCTATTIGSLTPASTSSARARRRAALPGERARRVQQLAQEPLLYAELRRADSRYSRRAASRRRSSCTQSSQGERCSAGNPVGGAAVAAGPPAVLVGSCVVIGIGRSLLTSRSPSASSWSACSCTRSACTRSTSIRSRFTRDRPRTRVGRNRTTATVATAVAPPQFRSPVASTGPFRTFATDPEANRADVPRSRCAVRRWCRRRW
ncbi:MAG: hypothetical protein QOJ71_2750, partial [Actinomycetota bacterium]|nr:hypothetical protein [Actinomycetota bacterium]